MRTGDDRNWAASILYVTERAAVGEPRWSCNGPSQAAFADPDSAVAWALTRASTVFVCCLGGSSYRAERVSPTTAVIARNERPWPPTPNQRQEIESNYTAKVRQHEEWDLTEMVYIVERDAWLAEQTPTLVGVDPKRSYVLSAPGHDSGYNGIHLDEFDDDGRRCGGRWHGRGANTFGSLGEVIAGIIGLPVEDPWVSAVLSALGRDRSLQLDRDFLEVKRGNGEMIHFSASANRESIRRWGLDWRRMGAAPGIAGSTRPELPAVFLEEPGPRSIFQTMGRVTTDLWTVDVTGLWIESTSYGWPVHGHPIPPERLRLVETDLPPRSPT